MPDYGNQAKINHLIYYYLQIFLYQIYDKFHVINFHKILGKDVFVKGILFFFIYIFLVSSSIMIIFVTQVNLFYLNFKFVL